MEAMTDTPTGLMSPAETAALCALARDRTVLEMGCYRGGTTVALARVARLVVTVDHHQGDIFTGPADTLPTYLHALQDADVQQKVISIVGDFDKTLPLLQGSVFDLILVDGAHDADSVRDDLVSALRLKAPSGIIVVHDYGRWDVTRVCDFLFGAPDHLTGSLAVYSRWPRS